jgi:hypothetical protein
MSDEIITKGLPHKKLLPIIEKIRKKVLNHDVVKDIFDKYNLDKEEINLIPICFAKIPVSARTDHGIIYINIDLLKDDDFENNNDHYLAHEVTHFAQQTTGTKPTPGSDDDNYLDNPVEQEGFQNQTKYISDTKGEEEAEEYIEKVLDRHRDNSVDDKKRNNRKENLLAIAFNSELFYQFCSKK